MFQQDSVPAQCAGETVQLLQQDMPEFISPDLWPSNSQDLNPFEYKIWGLMQQSVYKTHIEDTSQLKQRLIDTWSTTSQSIINDAIDQWTTQLRACTKDKGRQFEHLLH